jgi:hypothetical protein
MGKLHWKRSPRARRPKRARTKTSRRAVKQAGGRAQAQLLQAQTSAVRQYLETDATHASR